MKSYDIIVIGAGPGGYVAAIKAAQMGAKTAIIEKQDIGGVCLNWGCIPTKTLLKSAKVYEYIMDSERFGIDISNKECVSINWPAMQKRKDGVVKKLTDGVAFLLKKNGVDIYQGYGDIKDKGTIEVNGETLKTKNLILANGSSPRLPNMSGLEAGRERGFILTSKDILALDRIPKSLVIIGGGVIGVEFATLYNTLGTKVTILQRSSEILKNVDKDVRETMTRLLKRSGITIETNVKITGFSENSVLVEGHSLKKDFKAEKVLMSIGRVPNTQGLEHLGLNINPRGIETNHQCATNIPGVYAIGDINGKYMLAHVASAEGIVAVESIMGKKTAIDYNKVPSCIYGFPEIGWAGLTEQMAREQGHDVVVSSFPLSANGKALAEGESDGFIKIIADKKYGEVLGTHIIAAHATDMIAEAVTTMELEGTVHELAKAIHPHPTLSEIVMEAAHGAIGKPIHIYR